MGKIKTRLIKRTAEAIMRSDLDLKQEFEHNKKALGKEMPGKKVRNQIAGYIARVKRMENEKAAKIQKEVEAISKKE